MTWNLTDQETVRLGRTMTNKLSRQETDFAGHSDTERSDS